jgi:Ca2+-binding RTX toxin-like protein
MVALGGDDVVIGNAGADSISAGLGDDFVSGGDGDDRILAGAGDDVVFAGKGDDTVFGDAGADRIFGDEGNDLIFAGPGNDTVFGGAGDDTFIAQAGDGDDLYFGDGGNDTLDMSAITAAVTVKLGDNGSATSSDTGHDTLWSVENVITGSGNDTIVASNAVNVMDGGAGKDTFVFPSAAAADGDTIRNFQPGDVLDLSGMDANTVMAGNQHFSLVPAGAAATAAGQLAVSYQTDAHGEHTVVEGNVSGHATADFKVEIDGHQNLTAANFHL